MSKLKNLERKSKPKQVPSSDDPRVELRRLVREHKALTKRAVAIVAMVSDKEARQDIPARGLKKGDTIKSDVPEDMQQEAFLLAQQFRDRASSLESAMLRQLRQIPIYQHFLSKVFGCGSIVAAYLISEVDIHLAANPSQLRRFAGMAVINGTLERRERGKKSSYNAELRTRLYQMFSAMWKNGSKGSSTSKYLRIWTDYKHRIECSARNVNGKIEKIGTDKPTTVSAKGFAHSTGWHKAADIFLHDLYLVWRTLEGLPVRCPYAAEKLGYVHTGTQAWEGMRELTLDEALEIVGYVGKEPLSDAAE
jgi:hypothetical protein